MKVTKMIKLRENVGVNAKTQKMERINEQMKVVILRQKEKNKLTTNKDQKKSKRTQSYKNVYFISRIQHQHLLAIGYSFFWHSKKIFLKHGGYMKLVKSS